MHALILAFRLYFASLAVQMDEDLYDDEVECLLQYGQIECYVHPRPAERWDDRDPI